MLYSWTSSKPCPKCGAKSAIAIKCPNCGTLGCTKCVGGPGHTQCKVCGKLVTLKAGV